MHSTFQFAFITSDSLLRSVSRNELVVSRVVQGQKVIIDKMEKFSIFVVVLLTLVGTPPTSANNDNEGKTSFFYKLRNRFSRGRSG